MSGKGFWREKRCALVRGTLKRRCARFSREKKPRRCNRKKRRHGKKGEVLLPEKDSVLEGSQQRAPSGLRRGCHRGIDNRNQSGQYGRLASTHSKKGNGAQLISSRGLLTIPLRDISLRGKEEGVRFPLPRGKGRRAGVPGNYRGGASVLRLCPHYKGESSTGEGTRCFSWGQAYMTVEK